MQRKPSGNNASLPKVGHSQGPGGAGDKGVGCGPGMKNTHGKDALIGSQGSQGQGGQIPGGVGQRNQTPGKNTP